MSHETQQPQERSSEMRIVVRRDTQQYEIEDSHGHLICTFPPKYEHHELAEQIVAQASRISALEVEAEQLRAKAELADEAAEFGLVSPDNKSWWVKWDALKSPEPTTVSEEPEEFEYSGEPAELLGSTMHLVQRLELHDLARPQPTLCLAMSEVGECQTIAVFEDSEQARKVAEALSTYLDSFVNRSVKHE